MTDTEPAPSVLSPLATLRAWIAEARATGMKDPDAMTVATVNASGWPSARVVLCRKVDDVSLTFFTNYESRKGEELLACPRAAAVFYWRELDRQVRVEGEVTQVTAEESDAYFASRPRGSQIAACVSPQSRVIERIEALAARHAALDKELGGREVTRPQHWGGYRVEAKAVELWRAGEFRMHDRLRYERGHGAWTVERLAP